MTAPAGVRRAFVVDEDVHVFLSTDPREDGRPCLEIACDGDHVLVHVDTIDKLIYAVREVAADAEVPA